MLLGIYLVVRYIPWGIYSDLGTRNLLLLYKDEPTNDNVRFTCVQGLELFGLTENGRNIREFKGLASQPHLVHQGLHSESSPGINVFLQRDLSWQPLPSFRHVHRLCFTKMTMIYVGALIMLWVVAVISDPMKRN